MDSKATGLTLSLGIVAAIIGYVMWQSALGLDTKLDDITTILQNSADGVSIGKIATILIGVGLVVHAAGLLNTRGIAGGNSENTVIAGDHSASNLWIMINNGSMPPGNNPKLSQDEIDLIALWIDEGAKNE